MKMKKFLSVVLIMVLALTIFSGCNNKQGNDNTDASSKNEPTISGNKLATFTMEDIDGKKYTIDLIGDDYSLKKVENQSQIDDETFPQFHMPDVGDEIAIGNFSFNCTNPDGTTSTLKFESNFFQSTKMAINLNKIDKFVHVMDNKNVSDFLVAEFIYRNTESSRARHLFAIKDGQFVEVEHVVRESVSKGFVYGVKFVQADDGTFVDTLVAQEVEQMSNVWEYNNATAQLVWKEMK